MQKTSLTKRFMTKFLAAQVTYHEIQIGLFFGLVCKEFYTLSKIEACKNLAITIKEILEKNNLNCSEIDFIGTNQGPAPFTTLRVLIATLNGIAFASNIPLVGADGLQAFLSYVKDEKYPQTVILLNAYNKDLYYAYQENHQPVTGWENAEILFNKIHQKMPTNIIRFLGNGVQLFKNEIINIFGKQVFLPETLIEFAPLETIAKLSLEQFNKKITTKQLQPLYLKSAKLTT